jgi:glyoxylase-like metal-dependent hydrolase (beta-lactamase superfamily II)
MHSLRTVLSPLPDATTVYPGHGPHTTIGEEKRDNPYLR